jgi:hypothetical protein
MIALLLIATLALPPAPPQLLASLIDRNRVLLIFAPNQQDERYQQELRLLARHSAELRERDVVIVPNLIDAGAPTSQDTLRQSTQLLSPQEQIASRKRYGVPPGEFTVILLGKDGGEKLRSKTPLAMDVLDRTIDAMPMRQDEIRQRHP